MPTLHDLQSDFRRFLTGEAREQLLQVVDGIGFDSESRLSIYRNNTIATLTAALKATFPVVCRLVDDRFFDYAAHAFIQHNLPASPCLVEYGGDFPTFLAGFPPAADLDYLPDVARTGVGDQPSSPCAPFRNSHLARVTARVAGRSGANPSAHCGLRSNMLLRRTRSIASGNSTSPATRLLKWYLDRIGAHLEIRSVDGLQITDLPPAIWTFRARIAAGTTLGAAAADALAIAADFDLAQALAALFNAGAVSAILRPTDLRQGPT